MQRLNGLTAAAAGHVLCRAAVPEVCPGAGCGVCSGYGMTYQKH